ncbi:hypothetical protein [Nocardia sienata]|uniref:hypothetical protein n=1 Tax=Nocardia sienata TaxID=248552 RepID=UPI00157D34BD|nr:hypothetical protein [Nocardia sienata]
MVPILGPPAAGKSTLALALGADPPRRVFRLREHVPVDVLAATTSAADRLGWIDDSVVDPAVRRYLTEAAENSHVDAVLMDNFPGTGAQTRMLIDAIVDIAPECALKPVELLLDEKTRKRRARQRRVCHGCEKDPISDPRMPAEATAPHSWTCARCGSLLHPRRGDAPSLFAARSRRHQDSTDGIRTTFATAGYPMSTLNANQPPSAMARLVDAMLNNRSHTA